MLPRLNSRIVAPRTTDAPPPSPRCARPASRAPDDWNGRDREPSPGAPRRLLPMDARAGLGPWRLSPLVRTGRQSLDNRHACFRLAAVLDAGRIGSPRCPHSGETIVRGAFTREGAGTFCSADKSMTIPYQPGVAGGRLHPRAHCARSSFVYPTVSFLESSLEPTVTPSAPDEHSGCTVILTPANTAPRDLVQISPVVYFGSQTWEDSPMPVGLTTVTMTRIAKGETRTPYSVMSAGGPATTWG